MSEFANVSKEVWRNYADGLEAYITADHTDKSISGYGTCRWIASTQGTMEDDDNAYHLITLIRDRCSEARSLEGAYYDGRRGPTDERKYYAALMAKWIRENLL